MKTIVSTLFIALVLLMSSNESRAACSCECVNGSVQAICSSSIDVRPVCAPRVCPVRTPSVRPIDPPTVPPVGTSFCRSEQVLNPQTNRYEWKRVCR
jgi:hypothetical protein